jgi:outer membrane protein TolC
MTINTLQPQSFMTMILRKNTPPGARVRKPKAWRFLHPYVLAVPSISRLKLMGIIAWACLAMGLTIFSQPVQGAPARPETQTLTPSGLLTFDEGVKIALNQSPAFTKSSLELEIKRLDETDSRYGLFPSIDFRTTYYLSRPSGTTGSPFSLNFTTDPNYNPVASYFTLEAQKLATRAAILTHIKTISAGLERLGQLFLELDFLKSQAQGLKNLASISQEKLAYAEHRFSAGTGTSLEVKDAQQGVKVIQNELEHAAYTQKRTLANLKDFLGLPPTQEVTPDFQNARQQVVGSFDPATVTFEQAKSRAYDLKIMEILLKLQEYNVKLAKVKSFPTVLFTTQTPDPLYSTSKTALYAGIGLYVPLWDGFKRIRNVSRQKTILRQYDNDKSQVEKDLENKFLEAQEKVKDSSLSRQLVQSQLDLVQLKAQLQEASYQSGGVTLPVVLDSRRDIIETKRKLSQKTLEYDRAILALRQISGDLGYSYVDANSWQK